MGVAISSKSYRPGCLASEDLSRMIHSRILTVVQCDSNWQWPNIKGLHSFQGLLQHSAHFDESVDLTGKRVAVIGMGSSGIQITSDLGPKVKKLYTWIRSPTWVTAGFAQKYAGPTGRNFNCTYEGSRSM